MRPTLARGLVLLALAAAGCAQDGAFLRPGVATESDLRRDMGEPSEVYTNADGSRQLAYPKGPLGERTFMAYLSREGTLQRVEQVLDEAHFKRIAPGMSRDQVRRELGPPSVVLDRPVRGRMWWDYRFRDAWGYTSDFAVIFDADGLVVETYAIRVERGGDTRR